MWSSNVCDLLGRRRRAVDRAGRDRAEPPVDAEALGERLEPRVARVGGAARRPPRGRRPSPGAPCTTAIATGTSRKPAAADHAVPQTRGLEEPVGQRARRSDPTPTRCAGARASRSTRASPRPARRARAARRAPPRAGRRAGEPAARRVRDRPGSGSGGRRKTSSAGANAGAPSASETPSTKASSRVLGERREGEATDARAAPAWKSAKRSGRHGPARRARGPCVRSSRDVGRYVAE